jgi:CIC family chloride channel protein
LGIAFAKIATTTLTVGTGAAGGLFGPTAVIGGMTGGAFGLAFHELVPSIVPQPGAFVLVGMACFVGGVAKAPISTMVIASEMTGSYDLLVPLMLAEVVTYAMSRRFSLYLSQVRTRRESPAHGGEYVLDVLQDVNVADVFDKEAVVLPVEPETPVVELLRRASESEHAVFPVVSADGTVRGIVTMNTLRAALVDEDLQRFAIAEDCASPFVSIAPSDTLGAALERFALSHYPELPVVSEEEPDRILGLLSYEDLLEAYSRELSRRQRAALPSEPPISRPR